MRAIQGVLLSYTSLCLLVPYCPACKFALSLPCCHLPSRARPTCTCCPPSHHLLCIAALPIHHFPPACSPIFPCVLTIPCPLR